jgi:cytochrome oxidase Cu insertion factor (SCO1/SenC/PrrC family)
VLVRADDGPAGAQLLPNGERPATESPYDPEGLPKFSLTERRGKTVTNETLQGSPAIFGFIFARCTTVCPRVSAAMKNLRKPLKEQGVTFVTLTVDPEHDTPEVLDGQAFFQDAGKDEGWLWLTGSQKEIYTLIRDGFDQPVVENVGEDRKPGFEIFHTANLMLVGPDGVVRGKYNSQVPSEMIKLRRDATKLAEESRSAEADGSGAES